MKAFTLIAILATAFIVGDAAAQGAAPKIRVLSAPEDATQKTVLIGRAVVDNMIVKFELEPPKGMWMRMGDSWAEHPVAKGEIFHVEVKPEDPRSKTRISYAEVKFSAVNRDNKKKIAATLHPMWGGSGLHYAVNSPLAGDGVYDATITVGVPGFARAPQDKNLWMKPVVTRFHFKLAGGKLVEVSEPDAEPKK